MNAQDFEVLMSENEGAFFDSGCREEGCRDYAYDTFNNARPGRFKPICSKSGGGKAKISGCFIALDFGQIGFGSFHALIEFRHEP